jgi:DNA-binding transcriptional ArsR family regulator
MELKNAIDAFASLAQETRLQVFRLLIEYGQTGTPAGTLSERLKIPQNTLSFHLSHLSRAGLINSKRDGKQIIYSANCDSIEALILYLKENCCILESPKDGSKDCCPPSKVEEPKKYKGGKK